MVTDCRGWGTVTLTTPQQPGCAPLLVKYPHLRKTTQFSSTLNFLFVFILAFYFSKIRYPDGVVAAAGDQQRFSVQEGCRGNICSVGVSVLSNQLVPLQIPECNVALWAGGSYDGGAV